ncbi:MAG: DUF4344 domain-containing metallopeptidase [Candidatus Sericytochromatia bacterium]
MTPRLLLSTLCAAAVATSAIALAPQAQAALVGADGKPVAAPTPRVPAHGALKLTYEKPKNAAYAGHEKHLREGRRFDKLVDRVNAIFKLPRPIPVTFQEIGQANAFYDPTRHRIVMGYELFDHFNKLFTKSIPMAEDRAEAVENVVVFAFLHELGHAMVFECDLPIVGRDEDAADQFATLMLAQSGAEGRSVALSAALWFEQESANQTNIRKIAFADEHPFDLQRFLTIVGYLYASQPKLYGEVARQNQIQQRLLDRYSGEYQRRRVAWNRLLEPYKAASFKF